MITLLALITSGCSSLTGPSATATPTVNPNAVTLKPTVLPSVAASPTGVATTAQGTTISASVNQNVPLQMDAGGYFIKVQSQGYISVDSTSQGSIAGINSATGGVSSKVMQYSAQTDTFKIANVNAPYTITIAKLPLANPATPPKTFTGTGIQATDPIKLNKGTAMFDISCPDTVAGSDVQMLDVHLLDGNTGDELARIAQNTGNSPTQPFLTNYNAQVTYDIPANGVYILAVEIASPNANWKISVSQ